MSLFKRQEMMRRHITTKKDNNYGKLLVKKDNKSETKLINLKMKLN